MEAFHAGKLDKQHHHHHHHHHPPPPVEFLPGGARYGAKSHGAYGNAFNSWNDYLGLATLVTKAVSQEQGFRSAPSSVVVAATVQQVQAAEEGEEDDDDEEEEEEEEDDDDEEEEDDGGAPYFESALDLRDFDLCSHHHHHHHHLSPGESLLEERFADFSPFSGRGSPASSVVFNCAAADPLAKDRSAHAWGGRLLVDGRLHAAAAAAAAPKSGARLLKPPPELQVCVFCRNNKEAVALYTTHILKGPDGRVLCPVLRRYTCPLCGASGDNAHTIKYCPLSKMHGGGSAPKQPLKSARHILGKKLR